MTRIVSDDDVDLAAARAGDAEAFARIYDRHGPVVLSICRRHGLAAAEDDCQETFIRAFRRLDQLDDPRRLGPWLYRIAANVCRERRRSDQRRTARTERWSALHGGGLSGAGDAPGEAERNERLEQLGEALARLGERERLALHLHYHEADPGRAAREVLQVSRRGYYALLARARDRLTTLMGVLTR
ncbi:MAG: RNA polymerase sigma factor [Planctomycetota bacterium]|jgi:RNA polymerase sigma-70 factor (ECF subfamily)